MKKSKQNYYTLLTNPQNKYQLLQYYFIFHGQLWHILFIETAVDLFWNDQSWRWSPLITHLSLLKSQFDLFFVRMTLTLWFEGCRYYKGYTLKSWWLITVVDFTNLLYHYHLPVFILVFTFFFSYLNLCCILFKLKLKIFYFMEVNRAILV